MVRLPLLRVDARRSLGKLRRRILKQTHTPLLVSQQAMILSTAQLNTYAP